MKSSELIWTEIQERRFTLLTVRRRDADPADKLV
jgi:hypothetical protein